MLESVAALRVATCFLTKWYYFYKIQSKFLHSQSGSNTSKETTVNPMMNMFEQSLRQYKKISSDSIAYFNNILSFFLKCLYFHTGYGDLVSCFRREWWLISNLRKFDSLKKVLLLTRWVVPLCSAENPLLDKSSGRVSWLSYAMRWLS